MNRKQIRNEKCRCGSGIKFKNCCGGISTQLYRESTLDERQHEENDFNRLYKILKSLKQEDYSFMGLPNLRDLDFVKMILDYWDSEKFKKVVWEIDRKPIDPEQMAEKKDQLLNMSDGVKNQAEMRFVILHTPHYVVFAYHIPKPFYKDPLLICAYELYSDPISIELRTYGSPYQIAKAMEERRDRNGKNLNERKNNGI